MQTCRLQEGTLETRLRAMLVDVIFPKRTRLLANNGCVFFFLFFGWGRGGGGGGDPNPDFASFVLLACAPTSPIDSACRLCLHVIQSKGF